MHHRHMLFRDREAHCFEHARDAHRDAFREFAKEAAYGRFFVGGLRERHQHARVLVAHRDIRDRCRGDLERRFAREGIDGGELAVDGGARDSFDQRETRRIIVGEMTLTQARARGDARLREARIAFFAQRGEGGFEYGLSTILHGARFRFG